jgi:hypothetical protein
MSTPPPEPEAPSLPNDLPAELRPGDFMAIMKEASDREGLSLIYQQRFVGLVDILGYRAILAEYGSDSPKQLFRHVLDAFAWTKSLSAALKLSLFSDTLVIESTSDHPVLFWTILSAIDQLRSHLLRIGVLLRGAVTFGEHFSEKGVWISPALVRAHLLESQIANMPRIVLDRPAYERGVHAIVTVPDGRSGIPCGRYLYKPGLHLEEGDFDGNAVLVFDPNNVELRYLKNNQHPDVAHVDQHREHCIEAGNAQLLQYHDGLRLAMSRAGDDLRARAKVSYAIAEWNRYVASFYHSGLFKAEYTISGF